MGGELSGWMGACVGGWVGGWMGGLVGAGYCACTNLYSSDVYCTAIDKRTYTGILALKTN